LTATNDQYLLATITEFVCIHTIPNVDSFNNRLVFSSEGETITVVIRPINHTITSLLADINEQLTPHTMQAVFNQHTMRISFYSNTPFSISDSTTCGTLIGVARTNTNAWDLPIASGVTPAYSIEMPNSINLTGPSHMNVRVNNFAVESFSPSGLASQVFARIPLHVNYGSINLYRPIEPLRFPLQTKMIDVLDLTLSNEQGRVLPMSFDFQIQFTFHTMHHLENRDSSIGTISWFLKTKVRDLPEDAYLENSDGLLTN
jgi:hypothetical protein